METSASRVARAGLLTGLAAALPLSSALAPGLTVVLTGFSTLPVFLLARRRPADGLAGLLAAGAIVGMVKPWGAALLLLFSGPLGLALGWAGHVRLHPWWRVIAGTAALMAGMLVMAYGLGLPMFGAIVPTGTWLQTMVMLAFSLAYSFVWLVMLESYVMDWLRRHEKATG